jgi:hypothetical protein
MTYENSLKKIIKNELIYYNKLKDLYLLIKLVIRINTRL